MNKFVRVGLTLVGAACFVIAWQFVVVFEPASPAIPFSLVFLSGFALREAIN